MPLKVKQQNCLFCNKEVSRKPKKFCNNFCQSAFQRHQYILNWKSGLVDGTVGFSISEHIRKYLHEQFNSSCQICGWNKTNLSTKSIPLEIHHIDGNYRNSKEENLQLLCPNCHALTENFGTLNKGKGRRYKRTRV